MDATMPDAATQKGNATCGKNGEPSIAAAIIAPTKDSTRSAPVPTVSPTLSPTLSAMTAALLGSSSGISMSTLPSWFKIR